MVERNKIFIDSNFYVAFYNPADSLHKSALEVGKEIIDDIKIISNLVFSEIVTVLSQRVGKVTAVRVGDFLQSSSQVQSIHIDEYLQNESWKIFKQIAGKNISFVDCSIIAAMNIEGINQLLTFDDDFKKLKRYHKFNFYI